MIFLTVQARVIFRVMVLVRLPANLTTHSKVKSYLTTHTKVRYFLKYTLIDRQTRKKNVRVMVLVRVRVLVLVRAR